MVVKKEEEDAQRQKNGDKCTKKKEPPVTAPMRILNEYRTLTELSNEGKTFQQFQNSCTGELKWTGLICPTTEPYNEKAWRIEFEIPRNYPRSPPKIKFLTPIYHPNVSVDSGEVKLEIIEKKEWRDTEMTDIINALLDLLAHPNAENSNLILNDQAAKQFKDKYNDFKKKAQEYAQQKGLERPTDPKPRNKKKEKHDEGVGKKC